jgi:hypothetical protein
MSPQEAFTLQIQTFHTAIVDDCNRAAGAGRSDAMVLRLRNNAVALTKLQLAMLAATQSSACTPEPLPALEPEQAAGPGPERPVESPVGPSAGLASSPQDRVLSGDALSRFVSRRLDPDESAHNVWQDLHEAQPVKRRRNPGLPRAGFRSSSG